MALVHRKLWVTAAAFLVGSAVVVSAQSGARVSTAAEARKFLDDANRELLRLINNVNRASWVQSTYITPDTEVLNAQANEQLVNAVTKYAKQARRFDKVTLPPLERREMTVLKNSITVSAPPDSKEAEELTRLLASMEGAYGRGKYCEKGATGENCLDIEKITEILAENRDPKRLQEVWEGWHTISIPMRKDYARFVELSNKGARALDYPDTGAMWRGKYDMPPDAFAKELDRLWDQLRPLFLKPRDREVVCHASAWDIDSVNDVRIKMCIDVNAEDFITVHHELGHNFYQRAYSTLPVVLRDSANEDRK